jgi:hypothetical protein
MTVIASETGIDRKIVAPIVSRFVDSGHVVVGTHPTERWTDPATGTSSPREVYSVADDALASVESMCREAVRRGPIVRARPRPRPWTISPALG